jgi:glycosyltransferase involved in cell wall biosynthesis
MKVTIIVPVYNVSAYIERCWESLVKQTYKDLEILFIDDCGTDNSVEKLQKLIDTHPGIYCKILHHDHNRGLSAARNTGLMAATGDYVYFLDSDDDITEDCIERLVAPVMNDEIDIVVGNYRVVGGEAHSPLLLDSGLLSSSKDVLASYAAGKWYVMAWNKLCRRDFLIDNNLFFREGLIHEDVLWTFQVACKAQSLYVCNDVTYNYNVRGASIMTSMSIERDLRVYLDVFDAIIGFVRSEQREFGVEEYRIIEGKKSGIIYSLLHNNEYDLYKMAYSRMKAQVYISPIRAWRKGVISTSYLIRDLHYALPTALGRLYKRLFYLCYYKLRGRQIEGLVWN